VLYAGCLCGSRKLVQLGAQFENTALSPPVSFQFFLCKVVELSAYDGFHLLLKEFAKLTRDGVEPCCIHTTTQSHHRLVVTVRAGMSRGASDHIQAVDSGDCPLPSERFPSLSGFHTLIREPEEIFVRRVE